MNRKIIQALVSPAIVYAICDDGTLWGRIDAADAGEWQRLDGIVHSPSELTRRFDKAQSQDNYAAVIENPSRVVILYPECWRSSDEPTFQSRTYYAPPIPQDEMA